jgi:ribosomal 50S subunit-recycling heat shock protein
MKKALTIVLALLISVAFVTTVFAQAEKKAAAPAPAAAPEKAKVADKAPAPEKAKVEKKAPAAKVHQFTGEVTAVDAAAKTITVKGKKADMTFDVSGVKGAEDIKVGDKVVVKYTEKDGKMVAKSVKKAAAKKAAAPKAEKKEAPKAEPKAAPKAAPAPAPAPAK